MAVWSAALAWIVGKLLRASRLETVTSPHQRPPWMLTQDTPRRSLGHPWNPHSLPSWWSSWMTSYCLHRYSKLLWSSGIYAGTLGICRAPSRSLSFWWWYPLTRAISASWSFQTKRLAWTSWSLLLIWEFSWCSPFHRTYPGRETWPRQPNRSQSVVQGLARHQVVGCHPWFQGLTLAVSYRACLLEIECS